MTHRIVVLGAGYAGLGAANGLARRLRGAGVTVTVVNRTDRFVERVRLHQLAAGQRLREHRLAGVLDRRARLVVGEVTGIDAAARTVGVDGTPIGYDTLVYALGSGADLDTVPGVREHAHTVAEDVAARRLAARVAGAAAGTRVAVVGGGLTGIEAATELAEARPDVAVRLVNDAAVGGWLSPRAQRHLRRALQRAGIGVREGERVAKVGPDGVLLAGGDIVDADIVVWAAGFRAPPLAAEAGFPVDARGRMLVDDRLRSTSHPEVYGVGDGAAAPAPGGAATRMACQTAAPMGRQVARGIASTLTGRQPERVWLRYVWQNISIGRSDGITQFTRADDTPVNLVLTGRIAALFKELITRGAAWFVTR